jgi:hypothetical protein
MKPGFRTFQGDTPLELFVHRFIDDAHAAASHFAHNPKAFIEKLAREKSRLRCLRIERIEQETLHAFFPLNVVPHSVKEFGVVSRMFREDRPRGSRRASQGPFRLNPLPVHHPAPWLTPLASFCANNHCRASNHILCIVRSFMPSASAASSSVSPRKYFTSTNRHHSGLTSAS